MPDRKHPDHDVDLHRQARPNQGGIGSSEHGGLDSSELIPDENDEQRERSRGPDRHPERTSERRQHEPGRRR